MVEEKTKELLMKIAIQKFLEESGFDDKVWVISLICTHCHKLSKAFRPENTEALLFKCEECGHIWQLIEKPLGYERKKHKVRETPVSRSEVKD